MKFGSKNTKEKWGLFFIQEFALYGCVWITSGISKQFVNEEKG